MPKELMEELNFKGIEQREFEKLEDVLPETDILYITRIQKERFDDPAEYDSVKGAYIITPDVLKIAKSSLSIMHPLPRVGEITKEVDEDPRAAYFRQMENGLYVRMVLLAGVLGKLPT